MEDFSPDTILVPGHGFLNSEASLVNDAVKEYDSLLYFGFNPTNQDWCVYRKLPRGFPDAPYYIEGEPVIIVLGFQDKIPSPHQAVKRLWETDALRHGDTILKKMNEDNLKLKKEQDEIRDAQMQEVAERLALVYRQHGIGPAKVFFKDRSADAS